MPGAELVPVDSEHSAILQCLAGRQPHEVRRLVLTASGGPFRTWPAERIAAATVSDALKHPTWQMGSKITIDSATLANKALEVNASYVPAHIFIAMQAADAGHRDDARKSLKAALDAKAAA